MVHTVEVLPAFRRLAVARVLIQAAARFAAKNRAGLLFLVVLASNVPAIALYEALGMRMAGGTTTGFGANLDRSRQDVTDDEERQERLHDEDRCERPTRPHCGAFLDEATRSLTLIVATDARPHGFSPAKRRSMPAPPPASTVLSDIRSGDRRLSGGRCRGSGRPGRGRRVPPAALGDRRVGAEDFRHLSTYYAAMTCAPSASATNAPKDADDMSSAPAIGMKARQGRDSGCRDSVRSERARAERIAT